jgi:hypothetical protein
MPTSAAELVEEALDHLGGLGDAFAGVGDAGLAYPLLQVLDVLIDVVVDVLEGFFGLGRELGLVNLDGLFAMGFDTEFGGGFGGGGGRGGLALATGECRENTDGEDEGYPAHKLHPC